MANINIPLKIVGATKKMRKLNDGGYYISAEEKQELDNLLNKLFNKDFEEVLQ